MTTSTRKRSVFVGLFLIVSLLLIMASMSFGDEMTMSPHKFILNAKGQFEDAQAVIRMAIQPGYQLSDYQVSLAFNNVYIIDALDLYYCYIDDNFIAYFDRNAIQANPLVIDMAGQTVTATVSGWFEAVDADGNTYTQAFSCNDLVEILDPDKK
ncbi:MAG: hypothetical protein ABIJ12_04495 [bacterium]